MAISLFFESNMEVRLSGIAIFQHQHKPFYSIPQEERQEEQFALLGSMNTLMVQFYVTKRSLGKYESEETYCEVRLSERQPF